jgi:hypothetical protein
VQTPIIRIKYDIRPAVQKHANLPIARLRIVTNLSELNLSRIHAGIIFVFAGWSGPSVMALSGVTKILSILDLQFLDFIVLDNDCMTGDEMIRLFGHVFHGAGETLWIKEGQTIAEIPAFNKIVEKQYLDNTERLLAL